MLEKLCQVDKCVSQIDLRKRRAKQALITDVFGMYKQCAISDISKFNSSDLLSCKLKFHIHEKVNDVTDWLSQFIDISKYFVWYPELKENRF